MPQTPVTGSRLVAERHINRAIRWSTRSSFTVPRRPSSLRTALKRPHVASPQGSQSLLQLRTSDGQWRMTATSMQQVVDCEEVVCSRSLDLSGPSAVWDVTLPWFWKST